MSNHNTVADTGQGTLLAEQLIAPLQSHLDGLTQFMEEQVAEFEPEVQESVSFSFRHQGKRLRPLLVFFSGLSSADDPRSLELTRAAAILELIHLATLVHDDIIDDADIRHRAETIVARYGANHAVLLGDALFAHALKLATDFSGNLVCREVALSMRRVCAGEIAQSLNLRKADLTLEDYFRIIHFKTAELFALSCFLGSTLGGDSPEVALAKKKYGKHLGTAYQIYDDIIDFWGDEKRIGKTLGTDVATKKFTLPLLLLINSQEEEARQELINKILAADSSEETRIELRDDMNARGINRLVKDHVLTELNEARSALEECENDLCYLPFQSFIAYLELQVNSLLK